MRDLRIQKGTKVYWSPRTRYQSHGQYLIHAVLPNGIIELSRLNGTLPDWRFARYTDKSEVKILD